MAGLAKTAVVKKAKKHGVKAGQKSLTRPSQKKAVKNGRHQEKETPKKVATKKPKSTPALAKNHGLPAFDATEPDESTLMSDTVAGDELDDYLQEPEFDEGFGDFDDFNPDEEDIAS